MDGTTWTDYTADGQVSQQHLPGSKVNCENQVGLNKCNHSDFHDFQFFPGSTDRNTPDTQLLGTPVSAQYVRILPLEFSGQAGFRFDVLGCTPDCKETFTKFYRWNNKCTSKVHKLYFRIFVFLNINADGQ